MLVIDHPRELPLATDSPPRVLVPTMGALHDGHLALIRKAREIAGREGQVAVSIFVNPIQFDCDDDFERYPRPLDADLASCRAAGVDLVFAPSAAAMYFLDRSVRVLESSLSQTLCGASRPGHFDGVCTVVLKLFNLLQPRAAIFGAKDFQQLAIVRRMVRDLDVPVEIVEHPTLREPDGLAMSSRNVRLTAAQRADAPRLRRALLAGRDTAAAVGSPAAARDAAREILDVPGLAIDYLEAVDLATLAPVADLARPAALAAAVCYGEVRLIDHIDLPVSS